MDLVTHVFSQACSDVNAQILKTFEALNDKDFIEKTHLFNGRYENIYLAANKIPEIEVIINTAMENAASILKISKEKLTSGFWLNAMGAGDITTAHTHDDDDELLSCVYYIKVPKQSGNLIITHDNKKTLIEPKEGDFVFFAPNLLHEVSENTSDQIRLSIAFNFGLSRTE